MPRRIEPCRRDVVTFLAVLPAISVAAPRVLAGQYPERPIRLIHGFAPGGPADTIARVVAEALSAQLKQPVIVEPRPGAGGVIGADTVAKAEPDGYTLGLVTGGHTVSAATQPKLPFDPINSFAMISTIVDYAFVIAAKADFPTTGLKAVIEAAKASPGGLSYGSAGTGTTQHLTGVLLESSVEIKLTHVPYRGDSAAVTGLLGDQVQLVIAASAAALPHIEAGTVRALAVTTAERWDALPDVPTVAQSGLAGFDVRTWAGLLAPRGLPAPVLERLREALAQALSIPDVKTRIEGVVAGTVRTRTPAEMSDMIRFEIARWRKLIADTAIRMP